MRSAVKMHAEDIGFSKLNQTKIVTTASELGRNVLEHGNGGRVMIEHIKELDRSGLRMIFQDEGPGIDNVEKALVDGYTSKCGLGLGLSGSKRLMDDFELVSQPNNGTTITVTKWT
ncbi:MAG: anti-sigma regulatory factor [Cyanobacteria bacterium DS2.3.42]|nr:anti-sigma regulatory factor [Cyanobacteria bacterium DS2.3.42]